MMLSYECSDYPLSRLNQLCFCSPIHFDVCCVRIDATLDGENVVYATLDIRYNYFVDIHHAGGIALNTLRIGQTLVL